MNTIEMIEKLATYSNALLNIVVKSPFCTSKGSAARVCRWGGHIFFRCL